MVCTLTITISKDAGQILLVGKKICPQATVIDGVGVRHSDLSVKAIEDLFGG
ncbi:MAG: hypothetical protein AAF629_12550 [Chloroflexota bacterium]